MSSKVVIVDRANANINSLRNALLYVGNCEVIVSSDPNEIKKSEFIVLAGVGAFGDGMADLRRKKLIETLSAEALDRKKPFLGICLGMQMLFTSSSEKGIHRGLNFIQGSVDYLNLSREYRVPHVGWNDIQYKKDVKIFDNLNSDKNFYFVHSFHAKCAEENIIAKVNYEKNITAAVQSNNILGFQFHPEKSQENGILLLENFLSKNYF
tara:strand:+ start:28140 stop:28766 length:627 start_codon:yes stop_codon:yes gene_type:complete